MLRDNEVEFVITEIDKMIKEKQHFVRSLNILRKQDPADRDVLPISIQEALDIYKLDRLFEVFDRGKAFIQSNGEPERTFIARREYLQLSQADLACQTELDLASIINSETHAYKLNMLQIAKIATALGLDPKKIGFISGKKENDYLI